MKKICKKCKTYNKSKCDRNDCELIDNILKGVAAYRKEVLVSEIKKFGADKQPSIEDLTKPKYDHEERELKNQVEDPEPRGIILDDKKKEKFEEYLSRCVTSDEKLLKIRFMSYMRCKSIRRIAKIQGCTGENIRKLFIRIIDKMLLLMSKDMPLPEEVKTMTPKKFKKFMIVPEY